MLDHIPVFKQAPRMGRDNSLFLPSRQSKLIARRLLLAQAATTATSSPPGAIRRPAVRRDPASVIATWHGRSWKHRRLKLPAPYPSGDMEAPTSDGVSGHRQATKGARTMEPAQPAQARGRPDLRRRAGGLLPDHSPELVLLNMLILPQRAEARRVWLRADPCGSDTCRGFRTQGGEDPEATVAVSLRRPEGARGAVTVGGPAPAFTSPAPESGQKETRAAGRPRWRGSVDIGSWNNALTRNRQALSVDQQAEQISISIFQPIALINIYKSWKNSKQNPYTRLNSACGFFGSDFPG